MRWRRSSRLALATAVAALVCYAAVSAATPNALTSACSELCAGIQTGSANTVALCVTRPLQPLELCRATEQIAGLVTCAAAAAANNTSALCITPPLETHEWRIRVTTDAETLALAHARAATGKRTDATVVLDATSVTRIDALAIVPSATWSLVLETDRSPPTLAIDTVTLAAWRGLESLAIANVDLSRIDTLPAFKELTTLNLTNTQLTTWPLLNATPSLAQLDVSGNALSAVPLGSLPVNLRTLNVSRNQLQTLPVDLGRMRYLVSLSASYNNFADVTEFPMIMSLTALYLVSSALTAVPTGLTVLPAIKILDLSRNPQLTIRANTLPAALQDLYLRDCGLTTIPAEFRGEKTWRTIDLSENPLATIELTTIRFRTSHLYLDSVDLSEIPAVAANWTVATTLSLSKNPLGRVDAASLPSGISALWLDDCELKVPPTHLATLAQLKTLSLANNPLHRIEASTLPKNLLELHLANCSLSAAPADLAASNASLRTLNLSHNAIESISLRDFSQLETLLLQNNSLTELPTELFSLPKLRYLDLRGNNLRAVTLTPQQFAVLATRLERFAVDSKAFAAAECAQRKLLRGVYSVCVRANNGDGDGSSAPPDATLLPPTASPSKTRLIALIVGAVVLVLVLIALSWRLLRHRRISSAPNDDYIFTSSRHGVTIDSSDDHALVDYRIDADELLPIRRLATRPYGSIWLAHYQTETVIVKRINQKHISARAQQDFVRRLSVLARLDHPHILRLLGVAWTTEVDVQIVVEYMRTGNLRRYLTLTKDDPVAKDWTSRKVAIALSVAHALVYIHSRRPQVLHRDLRSRSVLLDEDLCAKVSGFGLRHYESTMRRSSAAGRASTRASGAAAAKSNRAIAPEVLAGDADYSEAADMYAFGVILSELDSHDLPFSDVKLSNGAPLTEQAMLQLLVAGALQPTVSTNCPKEIGALMLDCLAFSPELRPSAVQVVQRLQSTMRHLQRLSEISDDIVSSDERMDSFLGFDSSRHYSGAAHAMSSSHPQQDSSSSGSSSTRDTKTTGDRPDVRAVGTTHNPLSVSSSSSSSSSGHRKGSVVRFSDSITYKF